VIKTAVACALLVFAASSAPAETRPAVAVIPFQALGVSAAEAHGLALLFETELVKTGRFTVIEQSRMDAVLTAQEVSLSDCSDQVCAVEIGKLLAAEQIVLGAAGKIGQRYYLTVKLIDVENGASLSSENEQRSSLDEILDDLGSLAARLSAWDAAPPEMAYLDGGTHGMWDLRQRTDHPPVESQEEFVAWMLQHSPEEEKYLRAKWSRAQVTLQWKDIRNGRVLEAFLRTPRQEFARTRNVEVVYQHMVLDIGHGQTISGPHLVARMTDYLNPEPEDKVLEIGTGSGYQSAVLSELSNHVYTIEIVPELAAETDAIYRSLYARYPEYQNITGKADDGYYGWQEYAPFDRIIVTCGIDHIPPELLKQLKVNGVMLIPVGPPSGQTILKITKTLDAAGNVLLEREDIYGGRVKEVFAPFAARGGGVHSQPSDAAGASP